MWRALRAVVRSLVPEPAAPTAAEVAAALTRLAPFEDAAAAGAERPVFLLATGWRTGSTLLQRILVTDPRLLVWGELLGRLALLPRLTAAVCGITPGWPPPEYWAEDRLDAEALATGWIANLFPPAGEFRAALRQLFERWLALPARQRGFARWGLKEVRLGAAEAVLLRWLFPGARFVVITREPSAAFRSVKGSAPDWWVHASWPDGRIDDVVGFARHWNRLSAGWGEPPPLVDPLLVRYEELVGSDYDFRRLGDVLDLDLAPERALVARPGATPRPAAPSRLERLLLRRETVAGRRVMGY